MWPVVDPMWLQVLAVLSPRDYALALAAAEQRKRDEERRVVPIIAVT